MHSIIVGTAGHIDHGKSALVRALTGRDPDRLPEEKRRGITIDLGFADLELGDVRIGFVDVPGHERFVKNMLAGAQGIDVVALVIAADEGVMPQTREHFDICRLLGVQTGLVIITKTDLVEEELIQLVRDEAEELVAGSFLEGAPMLAVSAKTGTALNELKETLFNVALHVPARPSDSVARLPVDRAFSMKGFGAVVTGTLVAGEIREADDLELLPVRLEVRARGLQVHGKAIQRAVAGQRTAINLGGVDVSRIERGNVLAPVGRLRPTQILDVHVDVLSNAPRGLRSRSRVRVHLHAAEILGRIRVLNETGEIHPGESGFAQLRLESPVVAISEERFIIRSYSPPQTVAGGRILNPFALKHRGKDLAQVRNALKSLMDPDRASRVAAFLELSGHQGLRLADLVARTGWNDEVLAAIATQLTASMAMVDCDGVFVASANLDELERATAGEVILFHKRNPLARGLARETLRERHFAHIPAEIFRAVVRRLEKKGTLVLEKDLVRAREYSRQLSATDAQLCDRFEELYAAAALQPPSVEEAMLHAGVSNAQKSHARKVLQILIDGGRLVRVQGDLFFHRKALDELIAKVRNWSNRLGPQTGIDVATFKDLAAVSRKYAIPLLEFLDRERITRREGDRRTVLK